LHGLSAEVVDVAADKLGFMDATDNSTKLESFADLATAQAGTVAATGLTAASGVLKVTPSDTAMAIAADSFIFADATDGATRKDLVTDVVTFIAGTATSTGLTATSGVLAVRPGSLTAAAVDVTADSIMIHDATDSLPKLESFADLGTAMAGPGLASTAGVLSASGVGIAHMANDDVASTFVVAFDHDFGQATAKDTDYGVLGTKGTLIGGYMVMTEALNGTDASCTITLSSAATAGTPIATAITITKANTADGQSNIIGATRAFGPLAAGIDVLSTAHIYAYTAADGGASTRSTGIAKIVLFFQKSA
jgi:hypothetical protein